VLERAFGPENIVIETAGAGDMTYVRGTDGEDR
jgi:hypothetical protein